MEHNSFYGYFERAFGMLSFVGCIPLNRADTYCGPGTIQVVRSERTVASPLYPSLPADSVLVCSGVGPVLKVHLGPNFGENPLLFNGSVIVSEQGVHVTNPNLLIATAKIPAADVRLGPKMTNFGNGLWKVDWHEPVHYLRLAKLDQIDAVRPFISATRHHGCRGLDRLFMLLEPFKITAPLVKGSVEQIA